MTNRKLLLSTALASLLLHLLLVALTWNLPVFGRGVAVAAKTQDAIEVILEGEPARAGQAEEPVQPEMPTAYTEIPERLASATPPARADFLAMYNAIAADRRPGGEENAPPGADQQADFPQVQIAEEDLAQQGGVTVPRKPAPPAKRQTFQPGEPDAARQNRPQDQPGMWDLPRGETARQQRALQEIPGQDWADGESVPSILSPGTGGSPGDRGFDFDQLSQGDRSANTLVEGDFSLNTYEWDFAPWMHRFVQDLYRNWMAPYAYHLGVIWGFTRVRLVVEKDGRPSAMEIMEVEGHESLHKASIAALQAFAPYAPLPNNFPEDKLVILLSLHYPQWKR